MCPGQCDLVGLSVIPMLKVSISCGGGPFMSMWDITNQFFSLKKEMDVIREL